MPILSSGMSIAICLSNKEPYFQVGYIIDLQAFGAYDVVLISSALQKLMHA